MLYLQKDQKIIIWGCGNAGTKIIEKYSEYYRICFLTDKKISQGDKGEYMGYEVYNPEDVLNSLPDNTVVVIAMYQWEEAARYLQSLGMALMKEYITLPMFEYTAIDCSGISVLPKEMDIETYIMRMARGRKVVATYGLCHMARYRKILEDSRQFLDNYIFLDVPPLNATDCASHRFLKEAYLWKSCDMVLLSIYRFASQYGVFSPVELLKLLKPDCKVISITSATFKGYFPQHKERDKNMDAVSNRIAWGDKNIDKMLKGGKTANEIVDTILSETFYSRDYIESFFSNSLMVLEEDEKKCDIKIADYIKENFRKEILYYSWTHPIIPVLIEIAKRICNVIEITDINFDKYCEDEFFRMDCNEELVYPSVKAALGLRENGERRINPGHCYKEKLSTEEYLAEYIYWFQCSNTVNPGFSD